MTTFQRNAIISGYINSYCLICECFFETEEQTFSHIENEEHETRLLSCPHLEKYGNNGIRKVKAGYFCEFCSVLMATTAKVHLHIAEKLHYYNKGNSLLKQSGSVLTAFDDVLITESAWHSFVDDACALCNAEFDNQHEHKMERAHILKLLQNKVEFGEDNNLYRRIDKNDFHCLTCNCVQALSTLGEHFNDENHKLKYIQCQDKKKKFDLENPKQTKMKAINEAKIDKMQKTETKNEKVVDQSENVALNNMETIAGKVVIKDTNEAAEKAETNKDTKSNPTDEQPATPKKDTKTNSKNEKTIRKEEPTDPAIYAKDNQLAYDPRNTNAFCKTCENSFPSTLRGMKEHVQGRGHINRKAKAATKPAPKKPKLDKRTMEDFVDCVSKVGGNMPPYYNDTEINGTTIMSNDTVINGTICVMEKSYQMLTKIASRPAEHKCQVCLMNLSDYEMEEHCYTAKHDKGMQESLVITNLNNEFVREVRPGTFHCGFCNLIMSSWDATDEHLKTAEHKNSSASCIQRLKIHLPMIRALKSRDVDSDAFFGMFMHHMSTN